MRVRKKWMFNWGVLIAGVYVAIATGADLQTYMAFATIMLGGVSAADITDKKLNGAS